MYIFIPELARIGLIIIMFIPAWFITIVSYCLQLAGGLAARQRRTRVTVLFNLFLRLLFVGILVLYADLLWTKLPPFDMFPNARDSDFWNAFWWLTLAWWSTLVGAALLWKADMQWTWLRRGIVALTIAYPVLQVAYAVPIFIRQSGLEPSPAKPIWNIVQAALAIAFWIILLVLLLRHRYQVEKEIKTVRAALFYKYNNEQP